MSPQHLLFLYYVFIIVKIVTNVVTKEKGKQITIKTNEAVLVCF